MDDQNTATEELSVSTGNFEPVVGLMEQQPTLTLPLNEKLSGI